MKKRLGKWRDRVEEAWKDDDGVWIALRSGWNDSTNSTCHTIHEDTWKEALELLAMSEPCTCKDCQADQQ
jgi:hypothetical protein